MGIAFVGGTLGYAFLYGMKRALFSNEAGLGSASIVHAQARHRFLHPAAPTRITVPTTDSHPTQSPSATYSVRASVT